MNALRSKIEDILIKENYTFKQLADYLNLSEELLEDGLANKTLELRYLEDISKNLNFQYNQISMGLQLAAKVILPSVAFMT